MQDHMIDVSAGYLGIYTFPAQRSTGNMVGYDGKSIQLHARIAELNLHAPADSCVVQSRNPELFEALLALYQTLYEWGS